MRRVVYNRMPMPARFINPIWWQNALRTKMTQQDEGADGLSIGLDQPLRVENAIAEDKLGRVGFARSAADALRRVSSTSGFVLSLEGAWGSGKTSTLAMIEELLKGGAAGPQPVVVHFNPWLVGERDALLRQFLAKLAAALEMTDHAGNGKKVAKELETYSKAFDVLKLIPGAEPWASITQGVTRAVGKVTGAIATHKAPDIEQRKTKVEQALRKFPQPVVVIIDDIDRLFPTEVFEMVRIVKAVGDLPNVGYVLAWDASYVNEALNKASVPNAAAYLDKIVQVRMPLPTMSPSARTRLVNDAVGTLHPDAASDEHFPGEDDRVAMLYYSGLRELMEQPRDVTRVFNTVRLIEGPLRGEVAFADIIGLAALMVKAAPIYELLRKSPSMFVGRMPSDDGNPDDDEDLVKRGVDAREDALNQCASPIAIRRVLGFLFPLTSKSDFSSRASDVRGHLAAAGRLSVALQLSASSSDVSYVKTRRYLFQPSLRGEIERSLTADNCVDFIESMADYVENLGGKGVSDLEELCLAIARIVDSEQLSSQTGERHSALHVGPETAALRTIEVLVNAISKSKGSLVAHAIAKDARALTVAADVLALNYEKQDYEGPLICSQDDENELVAAFAANCLDASRRGDLFKTSTPGKTLTWLAKLHPPTCPQIFDVLETQGSLDSLVVELAGKGFDSVKGRIYSLKDTQTLESFAPVSEFLQHAHQRLDDPSLTLPARAAWRSLKEGKRIYGNDGSYARDLPRF